MHIFQITTTFETCFVENQFKVLEEAEKKADSNDILDNQPPSSERLPSRGPTVCVIRLKKFTMSGRTKEGRDDDRRKKKDTSSKADVKQASKENPRHSKRGHLKKKQRKHSKQCRNARKAVFNKVIFRI